MEQLFEHESSDGIYFLVGVETKHSHHKLRERREARILRYGSAARCLLRKSVCPSSRVARSAYRGRGEL